MAPSDDVEHEIDALYAEPPEAFTDARNALARRLKDDGDAQTAAAVRSLRKPVRSAWAVNRLVRDDRAGVEELIAVGDRLRTAQRRALSGAEADELRERSEGRRRLVARLTERAAGLLGKGDVPAAAVEDIAATLEAASIDDQAARLVREGRLTKPLPRPAGFGDVAGLRTIPGSASRGEGPATPREGRAELRRREKELRTAEERERRARERVERLREELEALRARSAEKRDDLRAAEAQARGAAVDVRRLRR